MAFWYKSEDNALHTSIFETVDAIQREQSALREEYRANTSLYLDKRVQGFRPGEWSTSGLDDLFPGRDVSWNVVRSVVDTLTAKLTVEKTAFRYQTRNGSELLQANARAFEQILAGEVKCTDLHQKSRRTVKNAIICGNASNRVWSENGKVYVRSVHPDMITIDSNACLNGEPLSRFEETFISRDSLHSMFPKSQRVISEASSELIENSPNGGGFRDLVRVIEAWRRSANGEPGRYAIVVDSGTLHDEEYKDEFFPYADMKYGDGLLGWHGCSLVSGIAGSQRMLNQMWERVQGQNEIFGPAFIFKPRDAHITDSDVEDNRWYKIIEGTQPPQVIMPPGFSQHDIQLIQILKQSAFEFAGIGEFDATGQNPAFPRIESARGLRREQDIRTKRFSEVANSYVEMMHETARLIMLSNARLQGKWAAKGRARELLESVDWSDLQGEQSKYHLKFANISALSSHPSGQIEDVTELAQSGLITREQALQLLDWPDLEKFNRLTNASIEDLERTFEHMLTEGDYVPPLPFQDLATGLKLGTSYWLRARMDGAEESRLDLVARWLQEASDMLSPPPEEPPPGPGPEGGLALAPDPLEGLPADPAAAQQLTQAAAILPEAA